MKSTIGFILQQTLHYKNKPSAALLLPLNFNFTLHLRFGAESIARIYFPFRTSTFILIDFDSALHISGHWEIRVSCINWVSVWFAGPMCHWYKMANTMVSFFTVSVTLLLKVCKFRVVFYYIWSICYKWETFEDVLLLMDAFLVVMKYFYHFVSQAEKGTANMFRHSSQLLILLCYSYISSKYFSILVYLSHHWKRLDKTTFKTKHSLVEQES